MTDSKRVQMKIIGRVQGVFFRVETQQFAKNLSLCGFVRNESDGSVTCVAEGPEDRLRKLVEWCNEGPTQAEVKRVEVEWMPNKKEFLSFDIKY